MEYRVGHLKLQPHRQVLDGAAPVPIGRKALDLLSVLARAEGALVTKDELMAAVWPGVIVEENAIQVHVAALRKVLGEAAANLSTVRGLGYRLTAEPLATAAPARAAKPVAVGPLVAVLAFENQSSDPDLRYFAEGVSEEILETVARIEGLRVIARTSSFQLEGEARRTGAVAAALGATHVLDGSVRRQGNRLRIGAQLVDARSETVVWNDRFDGLLEDLFTLQDGIAHGVATALRATIPPRAPRAPIAAEAYDLYLQARQMSCSAATQRQCIERFEEAVTIAPEFADAWASIALNRIVAARWYPGVEPSGLREQAREAANHALTLDPTSAVAHIALSLLAPFGAYREHESRFGQALALRPNDPEVVRPYGHLLWAVGRMAETYECFAKVWSIDPLSSTSVLNYAAALNEMGWTNEARANHALGRKRWPEIALFYVSPLLDAAFAGDWPTVDALLAENCIERPEFAVARSTIRALRNRDPGTNRKALVNVEATLAKRGRAELSQLVFLHRLGLRDEVFALIEKSDFQIISRSTGDRAMRSALSLA